MKRSGIELGVRPVSYTHLDVYKRQTYGNVVAVQEGKENEEGTKALMEALTSDTVKEFMETTYEGAVVPLF